MTGQRRWTAVVLAGLIGLAATSPTARELTRQAAPGGRVLLDAHNCYPEGEAYADRLQRALATGVPIAIEQDLVWFKDPRSGVSRSIVSHGEPYTGLEPSLEDHFFERIRPVVEQALREQHTSRWPLIVLNLDLKTNEPAHHAALWQTLGKYESWLTTTERTADLQAVQPMDVKPVLVLTGNPDEQEQAFATSRPVGSRLRLFGAIRVEPPARLAALSARERNPRLVEITPEEAIPTGATNYRRYVNYPWTMVERDGQVHAADWNASDRARLTSLVNRAHEKGLWIRFYTLNGHAAADNKGWTESYNFGSEAAAQARWEAAIEAGVDFVATDQYEAFAAVLKRKRP